MVRRTTLLIAFAMMLGPAAFAAGPDSNPHPQSNNASSESKLTPEQLYQKRFPQPMLVADVLGLPVLDEDDSTIGYVKQVVRTPDGRVRLIVPYSAWLGWLRTEWGKRPVAVPLEVVVILARQLDAFDMTRKEFDTAPTWIEAQGQPIAPSDKILVGLGRR